jgi:5-methyltetrahydrofolate--homocysteine methyltransferase
MAIDGCNNSHPYLEAVRSRVVIYDGATGTTLQRMGLSAADFGGSRYEGCNELLNLTRPDLITRFHESFLEIGCDVVETNTFGAFAVPLGEYGIAERTYEIARAGAAIAKSAAGRFCTPDHPRWVAGSIGPGTKFPSLGQIRFAELRDAYQTQAEGLLEGGVDLFIIETQFDLLGLKAAVNGCRRAMASLGRQVPIQAQVTIELTGRMLPGTEIGAALASIEPLRVDVIGLNCATGPEEMWEPLRHLARHSRLPVAAIPNAGLPSVVDGKMHYDLTPEGLAEHHARFITELGVSVVGGCCGTTVEHLQAVIERCRHLTPKARQPEVQAGAASLYSFTPFQQDASFLIVGERTNANGSKQFRQAMLAEDWDGALKVAKDQVKESAHLLDLCVDYVGRDGRTDMAELASRFATQVSVPLVLDSTEPEVMEAGLQWFGGRAVLNSANLEEGDGPGSRLDRVFTLAGEYGAAVICLLIDERGQARDVEWKLSVAHRLHDLALNRYGLEPGDLFFDPLTFPLSTGDEDLRGDGMATIEALRRIKTELPGVFTVLGVSNVSFGLKPAARHVLNSVFLHECTEAGLDAAIVHAGKIVPLNRIPEEQRQVCLDLIYDRRAPGYDPLQRLLEVFAGVETVKAVKEDHSGWSVEKRLSARIVDGDREGLSEDLDEALSALSPLDVINGPLLDGMKVVGDLFASGEMQLPFVLQSAETMKTAVAHLEPHMEKAEGAARGKIVLGTVRGDVHDIGKNLVDIILTNNGYQVHNLGIKVEVRDLIEKALEVGADAIGMSGLLVKSTLIMRDNLEELMRRDLSHVPVLLGGAALTRHYVEKDLRDIYPGPLFYGKDAFAGLRVMDRLAEMKRTGEHDPEFGRRPEGRVLPERSPRVRTAPTEIPTRSPEVAIDNPIFQPPFVGTRVVKGIAVDDIAAFLNETALFRNQWQFRPNPGESDEEFKARIRHLLRERLDQVKSEDLLIPQVVYGYFPASGEGDSLIIWTDETRRVERTRFRFPRQSEPPYLCLADFFRPIGSDQVDYASFHLVTMGPRVSERAAELFRADRYRDYLFTHGLGVEMAEALAEYWHLRIRQEWGFAGEDGPTLSGLFHQQYRGGRFSWGYPACPDLEDNAKVAELLSADRIGVECSEETAWQYHPEQSTSAIICHHPQAKYFIAR